MTRTTAAVWLWAPRVLGVAMALFLSVFALDEFDGRPILEVLPGLFMHLIPSFLVLAVVAVAWRVPLFGAAAFTTLAVLYGVMVHWRMAWVVPIGGLLIVIALSFVLSALHRVAP